MKKIIFTLAVTLTAVALPLTASAAPGKKKEDKKPKVEKVGQTEQEVKDSLQTIIKAANGGDAEAMNTVGTWYYLGRHYEKDYKTAVNWFAKSAKAGNEKALANFGRCYQKGLGVEANADMAMKLYEKAIEKGNGKLIEKLDQEAKNGDEFANIFLARHYAKVKDVYKSSEYYAAAAEKGSTEACRELGMQLLNNKQPAEAFKYFKKGYKAGDTTCTFWYGKMLMEGKGVKKDVTEGVIALQKAAEKDFANAQLTLSEAYYAGDGVHKDAAQGFIWLEKAAQQGLAKAQYQAAVKLVEGDGIAMNYDLATKWFTLAAANHLDGTFKRALEKDGALYGSPYVTYLKAISAYGSGDFAAALKGAKELQKSKVAGVKATGQTLEARVYSNKDYSKPNLKNAVKLFTKGAEADNATACYILGELYFNGTQVEKDDAKSLELFTKSAKLMSPEAYCFLGNMCYEGRGVKKDVAKAVHFYNLAGLLKTKEAAKRLADCYENGMGGLEKDPTKAEEAANSYYRPNLASLTRYIP